MKDNGRAFQTTRPSSPFSLLPSPFSLLLSLFIVLLIGLLCCRPLTVTAATPLEELLDALQRKYSTIEGFSADFQQIYTSTLNSVRREESGVLYMKKPGRMRWEYQKPETKLFVADGKKSYFYVPSDRQVTEHRYTVDDLRSIPILFLLGQGDLRRDFFVRWETSEPKRNGDNYIIRLEPKTPHTAFMAILVEIHRTEHAIERLIIIDSTEDRSEFVLTRFNPTTKLNDDLFKFKIPKGVEVLNVDTR